LKKKYSLKGIKNIVRDFTLDVTDLTSDHQHIYSVNQLGNGILKSSRYNGVGHTHTISKWKIQKTLGHDHELKCTLYYLEDDNVYVSSNSGETWKFKCQIPSFETGDIFACFSKLYIQGYDGLYVHHSGNIWNKVLDMKPYSLKLNHDLNAFFVGTKDSLYKTNDGKTFELIYQFETKNESFYFENNMQKNFGYVYNDMYQRFIFKNKKILKEDSIAYGEINFDKWLAKRGAWAENIPYDIYFNKKRLFSTKYPSDNTISPTNFQIMSKKGEINFGFKTEIYQGAKYGSNTIYIDDTSGFLKGDTIRIFQEKEKFMGAEEIEILSTDKYKIGDNNINIRELLQDFREFKEKLKDKNISNKNKIDFYTTIKTVNEDSLILDNALDKEINGNAYIEKTPNLDSNNELLLNSYESDLYKSGTDTHEEIEDKISGLAPYDFQNMYLSNFLQLTQALKYVYPTIDENYKNSIFYDFHYSLNGNEYPLASNYIDFFNSEINSRKIYKNDFIDHKSSIVNNIVKGEKDFSNYIFACTDLGIFYCEFDKINSSNWTYLHKIPYKSYNVLFYLDSYIMALTSDGVYTSENLIDWNIEEGMLQDFEGSVSSYRWNENEVEIIDFHEAKLFNYVFEDDQIERGVIDSSSQLYDLIEDGSVIDIYIDGNNEKEGKYSVISSKNKRIILNDIFLGDSETINIKIIISSWWQQFSGTSNELSENIKNTLIVGGKNRILYKKLRNNSPWIESLVDINENYVTTSMSNLTDGSIIASTNGLNSKIIRSTNNGSKWSLFQDFKSKTGSILNFIIYDFYFKIEVGFDNQKYFKNSDLSGHIVDVYSSQENGGNLGFTSYILYNETVDDKNYIYVYRNNTNETINYDFILNIRPFQINSIKECDSQVYVATNIGLYQDDSTIVNGEIVNGKISGFDNQIVVTNIDVVGEIKRVEKSENDNVLITMNYNKNISKNEFVDFNFLFLDEDNSLEKEIVELPNGLQVYKIISNSSRSLENEVIIELEQKYNISWNLNLNKKFKLLLNGSKIEYSFNKKIKFKDFENGYVDNGIRLFPIQSINEKTINLFDYVFDEISIGDSLYLLDSDKNIKLIVDFENYVEENDLVNATFQLVFSNKNYNANLKILKNGFRSITVEKAYNFIPTQEDTNETSNNQSDEVSEFDPSITSFFTIGDSFSVNGLTLKPNESFSYNLTSNNSDHYHSVSIIKQNINGTIKNIEDLNNGTYAISLNEDISSFHHILNKDEKLLNGSKIVFYKNNSTLEVYESIISYQNKKFTVNISNSNQWNLNNPDSTKISSGWSCIVFSKLYGYTNQTYYENFETERKEISQNLSIGDTEIFLSDIENLEINQNIKIIEGSEKSEMNKVTGISTLDKYITVERPLTFEISTVNEPYISVLTNAYSDSHEHKIQKGIVQPLTISDFAEKGYDLTHSHYVTPYISDLKYIKMNNGNLFVGGGSSKIYRKESFSNDFKEYLDLKDFNENNKLSTDIEFKNNFIICSSNNGRIYTNKK
jgi:hypothetical protein